MADVFHTKMVANGDWFCRGDDPVNDDWAVYNGTVVAETGDEIGSTGEYLQDIFLSLGGNRMGDWVLVANTDDPDTARDTVLLLNGEVVIREGDPIDLDGNGAFDDDVFIGRGNLTSSAFAANDIFLSDDRVLHFIAPLRNAAGDDLGSDPPFGAGGEAFMRVSLPCPTPQGDLDFDSEVDLEDYILFEDCLDGPGVPFAAGCSCADMTGDGSVSLNDFAALQRSLSGS